MAGTGQEIHQRVEQKSPGPSIESAENVTVPYGIGAKKVYVPYRKTLC